MNLTNGIIPTIYKPTRVTHNSATLVDNIYLDANLYNNVESFIIKTDISDHFMCLTIVHNCLLKTNTSQSYKTRKITDAVLRNTKMSYNV